MRLPFPRRAALMATTALLAPLMAPLAALAQATPPTQLPSVEVGGQLPATQGYQPLRTTLGAGVDTPLLDIPQNVAVVPRAVLQDQQASSLDEALANVSGVTQANNLGGTQDAFTRRGFGDNRDGSIMIDGLRTILPRSLNATTERVEVLKGPASALYGILDPGGLVNVVTRRPELEQQGVLTLRGSSLGGGSTALDVTGPIGTQGFAYRLIGEVQNQEYWRNFGSQRRTLVAPSLSWTGSDTTVEASYWHETYAVPFDRGTIFDPNTGKPIAISRRTRLDEAYNVSRGYSDYAALRVNHRLSSDWSLSGGYAYSLNNYSDQNARIIAYNPATGAVTRRADATEDSTMFSHALRADLAGRAQILGLRHDLLFGVSYDYSSTRRIEMVRGRNVTGFNAFSPVYGLLPPPGRAGNAADSDQTERLETTAFYAQDAIHLSDRWILVGGLRYQHFDQVAGKGRPFSLNTDVNKGRLVPRVGLVFKLRPDISLFASYSQSFKPNSSIANAYGAQPPETGESWELGAKFELPGGSSLTASVFNINKQNVLYRYELAGVSYNATAGEVRSRGIELDWAGRITQQLSLIGSYALIDAKVTDDPEVQGKRLLNVARHTAALFLTYDFGAVLGSEGLRAGFGGRYMAGRPGDRTNSFTIPSYEVFDAFVAYDTRVQTTPVRFQLNVKNIFDKTYYTSSIGTNLGMAMGEPLQAVLSASMRF
ncbi:TonB-dependent siderophore receptor [Roseomonas sp. 18066]|uniref:TonB-dependent siderophore receptor n=1 Tax=Roseomonas sp. 18066 TaxID=2681412 RepID=UPI001F1F0C94|nr:TonB-dependent siderophore receptor [Roseomonas sp. 18066]